jgi:signal transduction histidine kinase
VRLRNDFLRAVTHDLRAPLTSMRGRAQLVQSRLERGSADPAWLSAQMDAVCAATVQMLATVDELSDVARLQIGQELDLDVETVDVGALVRAVADAATILPDTTPVVVTAPTTPVEIAGDRARLRRVLENIIGNAVKYSPTRTPVAVAVDDQGASTVITVRDQGVGIPSDELPRLFTRYYRASTAHGIAGSGIGLAGAKAIVARHGGSIAIESAVGVGTTVTVTLPASARAVSP